MRALCISATASNQGKTILTTALLHHFRDSVRPFKIGPDFIDPQFHTKICGTPSVNLDTFIMNEKQVKWIFQEYSDKKISICEGVMGFYDGMDKGCSAYDVSKLLDIPTILLLDGSSSYITVSAVLKGLKTYRDDNTIKGVILNKLSSTSHFELIKNQILKDFSDVK
ncbi:MAG: AAA family ATPase, partial [Sulfurimonas sp.]|nr:AAA family ATPase [Sulfurimonas sp.]